MLDRGAKARDDFDALAFAALYGDAATLELLLARGANPNVKSKEKHRVFIVEGTRSFEVPPRDLEPDRIDATVKSLKCRIGYPADDPGVLYLVSRGRTAKGPGNYPQIVKVLLRAGADPNARTLNGATPLMRAASDQDLDVMNALIDGGADIKAVDRCGRSAADYADLNPRHPRADQAPWTKALLEQRSKK
jgi:ankyrin repeat protein